jgi:adenylyltransferase/sulfurtransferase
VATHDGSAGGGHGRDGGEGLARYQRQMLLPQVGLEGQRRLGAGTAAIVGCGALGAAAADLLARAGVGRLLLIDRDLVEATNLQRQVLYDEHDVGQPKAPAAAARLSRVNRAVRVEACAADLTAPNAERLLADVLTARESGGGVILDGTDNFETRYLLNDVCVKHRVTLAYGGVVGTRGLSATFFPGGACLRCVFEHPPEPGSQPTCDTAGVLGPAAVMVAARQAADAIKVLCGRGEDIDPALHEFDLWTGVTRRVALGARRADCPCCGAARLEFLDAPAGEPARLCGRNAVQVNPSREGARLDLAALAGRLEGAGLAGVERTPWLVRAGVESGGRRLGLTVFGDGRAIVSGTSDPAAARAAYARFVGA